MRKTQKYFLAISLTALTVSMASPASAAQPWIDFVSACWRFFGGG
jgi:hypothetical protein